MNINNKFIVLFTACIIMAGCKAFTVNNNSVIGRWHAVNNHQSFLMQFEEGGKLNGKNFPHGILCYKLVGEINEADSIEEFSGDWFIEQETSSIRFNVTSKDGKRGCFTYLTAIGFSGKFTLQHCEDGHNKQVCVVMKRDEKS